MVPSHDDGARRRRPARRTVPGRPSSPSAAASTPSSPSTPSPGTTRTPALCVVNPPGDRFAAIEDAAAVTGLPGRRGRARDRPAGAALGRARLPQRPRAGHRRHHRGRRRRRRARRPRCGRPLQRVVRLGAHAGRATVVAVNHQWSKADEFETAFAPARPRRAWPASRRLLLPSGPQRALGGPPLRRADRGSTAPSAAATAPSTRTRPSVSTIGAAPATSAASSTWSSPPSWTAAALAAVFGGREPLDDPAQRAALRHAARPGSGRQAVRVRRATSTSAGPRWCSRPTRPTAPARRCCTRLRADVGVSPPPTPTLLLAPRVPTTSRIAMRHPISWSALADASGRRLGPGRRGTGQPPPGPRHGRRSRAGRRRARRRPTLDGLEVLATGPGRPAIALLRCDVVVKSPGISRYRPEVAQLEEAGVPVCGGLGLFMAEADPSRVACVTGHQGQEHHDRPGRPPPARARLRRRGGRQHRPAALGPSGEPEPDYWIIETSSFQVPDLADGAHGGRRHLARPRTISTGTGRSSATTPTSSRSCTKPGRDAGAGRRIRRASCAPSTSACSGRTSAGSATPTWTATRRGRARSACAGPHNARNATMARAVLEGARDPGASDDDRWLAGGRTGSPGCPAAVARSAPSARSSSSTTASRPTCCRPQAALDAFDERARGAPRGRARPGRRLRAARADDRRRGRARRSWSPCPTTARASATPSARRRPR